jgi:orotate phosphoribosyltransferase
MSYIYRTYADAASDVREWSRRLPNNIMATCGIPRSGCIPALMLSQYRNIHHVTLESLQQGRRDWETGLRRRVPGKDNGIVLVIDDTSWSGRTIREIRPTIHPELSDVVKFAALYAGDNGIQELDYFGRRLPIFAHSFEWNIMHDCLARKACFDMDGVLCEDYRHPSEDGPHEDAYRHHLEHAKPLNIPSYPILAIVTARLEKYRPETEAWLRRHGVQYKTLNMAPYDTPGERHRNKGFGHRKARYYAKKHRAILFVENDRRQAEIIHRISGKPVFSLEENRLLGGIEPDAFAERAEVIAGTT